MHMDRRWSYDHEYFQRMIERQSRIDDEVVGCVISGMAVLNSDDSSSEDGSMPGLQDRARSDSSSSGDNTGSSQGSELYPDGEPWGCQEKTLKQILSGTSNGLSLASDTPTLYALSLHGHAEVVTADVSGAFLHVELPERYKANVFPAPGRVRTIQRVKRNGTIKSRLVREVVDVDFCQAQE